MGQNVVDVILVGHDKSLGAALNRQAGYASKLAKSLDAQGRAWQRTGRALQGVGGAMTRYVSIPLAAIGAASAIYAYKYEKSMMKVAGINRQSAKDMRLYRREMDALARSTGQGPAALADALYFVTSTGFKGAEAMKILEWSAKGAAMGMGETQVVADSLTTALAAYEGTGLTAARAMDILTSAIRVGKAEPAEFASRIGDVAANAAHLGVTFEDVSASIALMTAKGIKTAEAVTSINNFMLGLTKGTKAGAKYLEEHNSSYYKLREVLKTQGVIAALREVKRLSDLSGFKKTDETLKTIIPNIRSLRAVWGILGGTGKRMKETFDAVKNSSGEALGTFRIWEKTDVGKLQRAWASFLVSLKSLGVILLPGITTLVEKVASIGDAFARLSVPQKQFLAKLGLIAGLAGPAVWALGTLISSIGTLGIAFAKANTAIKTFTVMQGAIKAAFIGGAAFAPQRLAPVAATAAAIPAIAQKTVSPVGMTSFASTAKAAMASLTGVTAAQTAAGAASGVAVSRLSRTAQVLNGVARAAGGARAGFGAMATAVSSVIGPLGWITIAIAGTAAAIYGIKKLIDHFDTRGRERKISAERIKTSLRDPELHDYVQKRWKKDLGGTWSIKAGELIWIPNTVKVEVSKTAVEKSVDDVIEQFSKKERKRRLAVIEGDVRRQKEIQDRMKFLTRPAFHGAPKGKSTRVAPIDVSSDARAEYNRLKVEYDRIGALIKSENARIQGLYQKNEGKAAMQQISGKRGEIKKWQAELKKLGGMKQTSDVIVRTSEARQRIADLKNDISSVSKIHAAAILDVKVEKSERRVKQLKTAIAEMKKSGQKPSDIKIVEIDLRKEEAKLARFKRQAARAHKVELKVKAESSGFNKAFEAIDKLSIITKKPKSVVIKGNAPTLTPVLDTLKKIGEETTGLSGKRGEPQVSSAGMIGAQGTLSTILGQIDTLAAKPNIDKYVTIHYSSTGSPPRPRALGGIVVGPQVSLIGEAGPEAILPLNNPTRSAQILQEAGYRVASGSFSEDSGTHYHISLNLPQGTVVSDVGKFGREISPYVERSTLLARSRSRRGKVHY